MEDIKNAPEEREREKANIGVGCLEQERVIKKIIKLIIDEMEEPEKGKLTSMYVILMLKKTISYIENESLMKAARYLLNDES